MKHRWSRSHTDLRRFVTRVALALASAAIGGMANASDEVSIESIEEAHRMGSLDVLERLAGRVSTRLDGSADGEQLRLRYAMALIAWRSNLLRKAEPGGDPSSAEQLQMAREHLEAILERHPSDVEALVLHAVVLGESADSSLLSRILLGGAALRSLERAEEIAPDNPRVALERGIFTLHTPGFAGGGPEAALTELERAHALFEAQPRPAPWPDWGRVDTAAWLGQTLARLGRTEEARARYREGLAVPPPSPWILHTLMPALEGAVETKSRAPLGDVGAIPSRAAPKPAE